MVRKYTDMADLNFSITSCNRGKDNDKGGVECKAGYHLIRDESGDLPLERAESKLLFQIISDCYERRSLVITTDSESS